MSRVDEALRRAAEDAAVAPQDDPVALTVAHPIPYEDAGLGAEPFPLEMFDRFRPHAASTPTNGARRAEVPDVPAAPTALEPETPLRRLETTLPHKVVIDQKMLPASREEYRMLAARLHHAQNSSDLKVVMIASAVTGEGKTLTAANVALTFSESYHRRVLLIDGDLRHPTVHTVFGLDNHAGLTDVLASNGPLKVQQITDRLAVLPGGRPSADPMAALTSERMRQVLKEARDKFDWIIVDTPPVAYLPDANLLSAMVDGAIVVVRAESTPRELIERAIEAIGRERTLGVVLNQTTVASHSHRYNYETTDGYR